AVGVVAALQLVDGGVELASDGRAHTRGAHKAAELRDIAVPEVDELGGLLAGAGDLSACLLGGAADCGDGGVGGGRAVGQGGGALRVGVAGRVGEVRDHALHDRDGLIDLCEGGLGVLKGAVSGVQRILGGSDGGAGASHAPLHLVQ